MVCSNVSLFPISWFVAQFFQGSRVWYFTMYETYRDTIFTWIWILCKHPLTHLLCKLGESHGNQMREILGYLDIKG